MCWQKFLREQCNLERNGYALLWIVRFYNLEYSSFEIWHQSWPVKFIISMLWINVAKVLTAAVMWVLEWCITPDVASFKTPISKTFLCYCFVWKCLLWCLVFVYLLIGASFYGCLASEFGRSLNGSVYLFFFLSLHLSHPRQVSVIFFKHYECLPEYVRLSSLCVSMLNLK